MKLLELFFGGGRRPGNEATGTHVSLASHSPRAPIAGAEKYVWLGSRDYTVSASANQNYARPRAAARGLARAPLRTYSWRGASALIAV